MHFYGDESTADTEERGILDDSSIHSTDPIVVNNPKPKLYKILIEPIVFLIFFAMAFSGTVYTNQIQYQTCIVVFQYSNKDCEPLLGVVKPTNTTQNIQNVVQPYVANILMVRSLIESILPAFLSIVIGPWSDKFGRRPLILTAVTGYLVGFILLTILTVIASSNSVNPWLYLLVSMPIALTGGACVLITAIYAYASDLAEDKKTGLRMIIMSGVQGIAAGLGSVLGGYVYAATNVLTVFSISTGIIIFSTIYLFAIIEESLKITNTESSFLAKIKTLFHFELIKDLLNTCFQYRPNYGRSFIWLTMLSFIISNFAIVGESNIFYLFVQKKFDWTVKDYSTFNGISTAVHFITCAIAMVLLSQILKISNSVLGLLALACSLIESLIRALAAYSWQLYLGLALGCIHGIVSPMLLATLALVASETEVGKIFALTTSLQYLTALGAVPLYNSIYNGSLVSHPGVYNYLSFGLYFICFVFMTIMVMLQKSLQW